VSKIIGVDLGTTNSCVAVIEAGEPVVIPNKEGSRTTPSIVAFTGSGERLVGSLAKRQAVTNPERTLFAIKRLIGRKFDSPEAQKSAKVCPFKIIKAKNNDAWVEVDGKPMSPSEISACILTKMKETAEDYLGEKVTDAIITVPAYFNDSQRQATKDAGKIAGLNVVRIINEPTAAALAYGIEKKKNGKVAVFDLGGGTFDISILELNDGVFQVLSTSGDTFLGGEDFDMRIVSLLIEEFKKQTNIDLSSDKMALQRLKEASEKAKHELSSMLETPINLPFIAADTSGPKHLQTTLSRAKYEALVQDLIDRIEEPCRRALGDAKITTGELAEVILVGGMTRMPKVVEKVKEIFKRQPSKGINPDEVVAVGASLQGGVLKGDVEDVVLLDVTSLSLGVETQGGIFTKIIERNTTIPTVKSMIFSTVEDNQEFVNIHALQGEREMAADNKTLGRFQLIGIPPAPRGAPQIEVTFNIDANGIVHVSAKELGTGKEQSIKITTSSGLSGDEIENLAKEADQFRDDDKKKKDFAEARNKADGLLYMSDKSLAEHGSKLPEVERENLRKAIADLKSAMAKNSSEDILKAMDKLTPLAHKLTEAIYKNAAVPKP
jgi:molecular chaperone DnaK